MKTIKNIGFILFALLLCLKTFAQETPDDIKALKVGDSLADFRIEYNTANGPKTINFSQLKGKLIILDFWATWCAPCVKVLPRLDSLQKKYGDKISIIIVNEAKNGDSNSQIESLLKKLKLNSLLSVTNDEKLGKLFPHRSIPHDVWIDGTHKFLTTTAASEISEINLDRYLNDKILINNSKIDNMSFDIMEPLLTEGNKLLNENLRYSSVLTEEIKGVFTASAFPREKDNSVKFVNFSNNHPFQLYFATLDMGRGGALMNTRRLLMKSVEGNYYSLNHEEYKRLVLDKKRKLYSYNLVLPSGVNDSIFFRKYMLEDLNRALPYYGSIQRRVVPSLVLIRLKDHKEMSLKACSDSSSKIIYSNGVCVRAQNVSFDRFVEEVLSIYPDTPPIINETGYTSQQVTIDINLKEKLDDAWNKPLDIDAVKTALNRYGLDIVESKTKAVEVLVLTEKK